MKKTILILTALAVFFVCLNLDAAPGKYDDLKAALEKMIKINDDFTSVAMTAKDAKTLAKAMNNFAAAQREMLPEMKKMAHKYPELNAMMANKNAPEELKPIMKKLENMAPKTMVVYSKIQEFGADPAVQKAQQELQRIRMEIQKAEEKKPKKK